jgi:hypothetical protein
MADRRRDLAQALFGLTDGSEAQTKMASRISEAILSDLIQQCQKAWTEEGPGVLVIRRTTDDILWSLVEDIQVNLALAERYDDKPMASALRDVLQQLGNLDIETEALLLIASAHSLKLLRLPVSNPAARVQELLASWND